MFLSTVVRKTSTAMMLSYVVLLGLYCLPVAIYFLVWSFAPADQDLKSLKFIGVTSPLMAVDNAPLTAMAIGTSESPTTKVGSWVFIGIYVGITTIASGILLAINVLLFQARWRLTGRG